MRDLIRALLVALQPSLSFGKVRDDTCRSTPKLIIEVGVALLQLDNDGTKLAHEVDSDLIDNERAHGLSWQGRVLCTAGMTRARVVTWKGLGPFRGWRAGGDAAALSRRLAPARQEP
jgi:hypothetical protein